MKTRLALILTLIMLAAACGSGDADEGEISGLDRPTTTVAPQPGDTRDGPTEDPSDPGVADPSDPGDPSDPSDPTTSGNSPSTGGIASEFVVCEPPEEPPGLEVYCDPFEIDQGDGVRIVWDRWFWGQGVFSRGIVEIFVDDVLIANGPFTGDNTIMEATSTGFAFYDDEGTVVAVVDSDDLADEIETAIEEAGIGQ